MAEVNGTLISQLGTTVIDGTEMVPVEKGEGNAKVTLKEVKDFVKKDLPVPESKDGMSAYEIAVKNGFKGTEQEWLASLKGEDGVTLSDGVAVTEVIEEGEEKKKQVPSANAVAAALKKVQIVTDNVCNKLFLNKDVAQNADVEWQRGYLNSDFSFVVHENCLTTDFIEIIPAKTHIRFKSLKALPNRPLLVGYDKNKQNPVVLQDQETAEPMDFYPDSSIHFIRASHGNASRIDSRYLVLSIESSSDIILAEANKYSDTKAQLINDIEPYSFAKSDYEIEKGFGYNYKFVKTEDKDSCIVYIPLPPLAKSMFFLGEYEVYENGNNFFADSQKTLINHDYAKLSGDKVNNERNGGYFYFPQVCHDLGQTPAYLVVTTKISLLDKSGFFFGDYLPFLDLPHVKDSLTSFSQECNKNNLVDDFGIITDVGYNNLPAQFPTVLKNGVYGIDYFVKEEDDPMLRGMGIVRCVKYSAGLGIKEIPSYEFSREYQFGFDNACSRASQYKVCVLVKIDEAHADILDHIVWSLKKSLSSFSPSHGDFFESQMKRFKKKVGANLFLVGAYLTLGAGTESANNIDHELYRAIFHLQLDDTTTEISFHGGWVFEAAWKRNSIRDYSCPTLEDLSSRNEYYTQLAKIEQKQDNPWYGKSILCVGTSYMHSNATLAERIAKKLGCILQNSGNVGACTSFARGEDHKGTGGEAAVGWQLGLSMTNAEAKEAKALGHETQGWWTIDKSDYESLIMRYICDDNGYLPKGAEDIPENYWHRPEGFPRPYVMLVLDGQNESGSNNHIEQEPPTFTDRSTFRGAWNYILTEIAKVHPQLKVIFLSNPGITQENNALEGLNVYNAQQAVVKQWSLPFIDFTKQLGVVNDYRNGDITDYWKWWGGNHFSHRCAERMAQIVANYLHGLVIEDVAPEKERPLP